MSLIQKTFAVSDEIQDNRTLLRILAHTMSELGELAEEVEINAGVSHKLAGEDGIVGESVDLILCALDMIRKHDPTVTEVELEEIAVKKLAKWKKNALLSN